MATAALLLHRGANAAATNSSGLTVLMAAAHNGHTTTAALLLDGGADAAAAATNGATALMFAAGKGHPATAALLLDRGADVDAATGGEGWTALRNAASGGHTATVVLLLDRGADIAATDMFGETALVVAARPCHILRPQCHTQTVAVLAFFGAEASPQSMALGWYRGLNALLGCCRLRIAASFRLHDLLRRALRSGAIARDPSVAVSAKASQLASSMTELWQPSPVCAATVRLVRQAVSGWSPSRHWLHHGGFRAAVRTLLLVHERGWRLAGALEKEDEGGSCLPYLDVELWFLVCGRLRREDFPSGPLGALGEAMRPRPWVHAAAEAGAAASPAAYEAHEAT